MPLRLTRQRLNRTLLLRQHLLERVPLGPVDMVRHLVGLQAQENLPPYLSLAARLTTVDPSEVSRLLEDSTPGRRHQTARLLRPLRRRAERMARPARVRIRRRNPCTL